MAVIDKDVIDLPNKLAIASMALADAEAELGCTFDWAGSSGIGCYGGPEKDSKLLGEGGWVQMKEVMISVRVVSLPDPSTKPQIGHLIKYHHSATDTTGVDYRVVNTINHWDVWLELTCQSPYRGA